MGVLEIIFLAAIITTATPAPWTLEHSQAKSKPTEELNTLHSNFNPSNQRDDHGNYQETYGIKYDDDLEYVKDDSSEGPDMGRYAEEYEYQSYMEKKVTKLVHSGSKYLEGLRRALEQYYLTLEECDRLNFTNNSTSDQLNPIPIPIPDNVSNLPLNSSNLNLTFKKCKELNERSDRVRRIAQLALYTTTMLQERVHTQKYAQNEEDYDIEDRALIIRLAWFLDKLAELTGYDPNVNEHLTSTEPPTQSTVIPDMASLSIVPDDIKIAMLECLKNKQNSPDPATVRCDFPVTYPAFMEQFFNRSVAPDDSSSAQASDVSSSISDADYEKILNEDTEVDFSDISEIHDHNLKEEYPPKQIPVKNDLSPKFTDEKHVVKRSLPESNPLHNIVNYYAKYKAWANVNPDTESGEIISQIHDGNKIEKRSSGYADETLDVIKSEKLRQKRSPHRIAYFQKRIMPRIPQDPMPKLDFFYKNKPGTSVNPDPVQAAQVRTGLERIFQNGNIEVLRRYGSNYNPAVPNQLIAGLIPTFVDVFSR